MAGESPRPGSHARLAKADRDLLIVSDAHLGGWPGAVDRAVERDLIAMLEYAEAEGVEPIFAGDLFDHWMEYGKRVPPVGALFRDALARSARRSGPYEMVTGNHDNWTGEHFPASGIRVHAESVTRERQMGRVLVVHGDGLRDPRYRLARPPLHRLLRHRLFMGIYRALLPPAAGWALMRWFSDRSRSTPDFDTGRLDAAAADWIAGGLARVVVAGHDHRARLREYPGGIYVNCGCFGTERTACLVQGRAVRLVEWRGGSPGGFEILREAMLPESFEGARSVPETLGARLSAGTKSKVESLPFGSSRLT